MDNFLICCLVGEPAITGSVRGHCATCDAGIIIAPTSAEMIVEHDLVTVCYVCALKDMAKREKSGECIELRPPTEKQLQEILKDEIKGNETTTGRERA